MRPGGTRVPTPNTRVKAWAADGTVLGTAWESRWLPDLLLKTKMNKKLSLYESIRLWGRSSVGRAPALQAGGQEFESLRLHCRQQAGTGRTLKTEYRKYKKPRTKDIKPSENKRNKKAVQGRKRCNGTAEAERPQSDENRRLKRAKKMTCTPR